MGTLGVVPGWQVDYLVVISVLEYLRANEKAAEDREGEVRGEQLALLGPGHPQLAEQTETRELHWSYVASRWRSTAEAWTTACGYGEDASLVPVKGKGKGTA